MLDKKDSVTIPKWFLSASSIVMLAAIPWAFHTSIKLNTLSIKLETSLELKKKFESHAESHISKAELQELRRRIERLENH